MKKRGLITAIALALLFIPAGSDAQENIENNKQEKKIIQLDQRQQEISDYVEKNKQEPYGLILDAFSSHQIILLGERHDKKEHRIFTSNLIKKLEGKINCVALEINSSFQDKLDTYLSSGGENYLSKIKNDSHVSIMINNEYLDILRAIKLSKLDALCIDNDAQEIGERDFVMAKNIQDYLKKNRNSKILIYAGNLHVRKTQKGFMTSIYVPLINSGFSKEKLFSISQESDSIFNSLNFIITGLDKPVAINTNGPVNNLIYGMGVFNTTYGETFDAVILHPK